MKLRHLVSVADLSREEIEALFQETSTLKEALRKGEPDTSLSGKTLALVFEKPSARTRISFEVAMTQLGGHALYLSREDIGLGVRESVKDFALMASRQVDGVAARTFSHSTIEELAENSSVPIINALSDYLHPCQALTDLFTIQEKLGRLEDVKLTYVGDGNNVARSLAITCAKLGLRFVTASPEGYGLSDDFVAFLKTLVAGDLEAIFSQTTDPKEAARDADVVYTDVWASMGKEAETEKRREDFRGYQVNRQMLKKAKPRALIMHCLPAHRGQEITDEVIDSPRAIVFDQAENRLHIAKAVLKWLIT